ncbi:MAG: WD40 repeat domain-containing protein [Lentisphaerae bacterium]|nr:WD40 repeat domain-containing protein [Lentisphaerota bacterium]
MNDSPVRYPLIAAAEQFSSRILLLDPNRDPLSDQAIVWQWSPMHDWDMDRDTLRQYVNLSEVKPVSGGTRLLVTASGGACVMLDLRTGRLEYALAAGGNPHSAELLPDGNVVTASSKGYLRLFDLKNDPSGKTFTDSYQESAHGVVLIPGQDRLFSSGKDGLILWQYDADRVRLIRQQEFQFNLPDLRFAGHDLVLHPVNGKLYLTGTSRMLEVDPDSGRAEQVFEIPKIKSISFAPGFPPLVIIPDESWWTSRLRLLEDGTPRELLRIPHFRFYKARWADVTPPPCIP